MSAIYPVALSLLCAVCCAACGVEPAQIVTIPLTLQQAVVDPQAAKSYQLWILSQIGRDNSPIVCDQLMARTLVPSDDNIVKLHDPIDADFSSTDFVIKAIPRGDHDRIFYIDVYDAPGQLGVRIGAGCVPSVTITGGKQVTVNLQVVTPPPAALR